MNKYRDSLLFKVVATLLSFMIMVSTVSVSMFSTLASAQDSEAVGGTNKIVYLLTSSSDEGITMNYKDVNGNADVATGVDIGSFKDSTNRDLTMWKYMVNADMSYAYFEDSADEILGKDHVYLNNVKTDTLFFEIIESQVQLAEFSDYKPVALNPTIVEFETGVDQAIELMNLNTVEATGSLAKYGASAQLYENDVLVDDGSDNILTYSSNVLGKHNLTVKVADALGQSFAENNIALTAYVRTERDDISFVNEEVAYAKGLYTELQNSGRTDVEISYEITSGEDVAEIADNTLKIKKPGTVTVKATVKEDNTHFVATFSYDVEVTKGTRTGNLVFETPNPSDIKFGENDNKFTNVATYSSIVDERDSAIGYEIVNGEKIASVDANGVLTVSGAGSVTVKAYLLADDYYNEYKGEEDSFTYTINVLKADLPETVSFSRTEKFDLTYGTTDSVSIINLDDIPDDVNRISFDFDKNYIDIKANTTNIYSYDIIPKKVTNSEKTVTATVISNNYEGKIKFTYEIKHGVVSVTNIDDIEQTYEKEKTIQLNPIAKLSNNENDKDEIESKFDFEITSATNLDGEEIQDIDSVATVDENGKISVSRSGKFEVKVTATPVDSNFNNATKTILVTINKAEDSGFKFTSIEGEAKTVTYGDDDNKLSAVAEGGNSTGSITYTSTDEDVASIDKNGLVTVKKAGTTKITASKASDDCYLASSVSFELTVDKANMSEWKYDFAKQSMYLGTTHTPIIPTDVYGVEVKYAVKAENNTANATIDADGKVVAKTIGSVVIVASVENDARYNDAQAEYTLDVVFVETPENPYTVSSSSSVSGVENAYNGVVSVYPNENLLIAYAPENWAEVDADAIEWKNSIELSDNVSNPSFIFKYVTGANEGAITGSVNTDIKLDNTAPEGTIVHEENAFSSLISKLSFGLFGNKNTKITATAKDNKSSDFESGVKSIEYFVDKYSLSADAVSRSVDDLKSLTADSWVSYDEDLGIVVEDDNYTVVYAKLTDMYGNSSYISTNGLIFENVAPSITTKADEVDEFYGYYYNEINVNVDVTDMIENTTVYSGINKVDYAVYAQGVDKAIYSGNLFNKDDNVIEYNLSKSFKIPVENNYDSVKYVVTATDNCGNTSSVTSDEFTVKSKPVAKVIYNSNDCTDKCKVLGTGYKLHNHAVKADIYYPKCDAFDSKKLNGFVDDYYKSYNSIDKSSNWDGYGNSYVKSVTFNDGSYTFNSPISFYDIDAIQDSELFKFIVDTTAPKVSIAFDNNDAVRDNFYGANRVATIKVTDENFVSAQDMFAITAVDALGVQVSSVPVVSWANDKEAKVEFTSDANYTFVYSVDNLIDLAGNRAVVSYADGTTNPNEFTVDKASPENMVITYTESESVFGTLADLASKLTNGFIYFEKSVDVSVTVTDAVSAIDRFVYSAELDSTAGVGSVGIAETTVSDVKYSAEENTYSTSFTVDPEYKGEIKVRAYDKADNYVDSNEDYDGIVVSSKKPVVTAEAMETTFIKDSVSYYGDDIPVTVTVEDVNFDKSKVVMTETTSLEGKDDSVTIIYGHNVSWSRKEGTNVYMATIALQGGTLTEGKETFKVEYTNNSNHSAEPAEIGNMVIDRTASTDLVITYKESDSVFGTLAELISKLSNGFIYFEKSVEVELKVKDSVSPISRFVYSAELDESAGVGSVGIEETTTKDITYDEAEKTYKTTFTVAPEYKGKIKARAYDMVDHYVDSNEEYGIVVSDKVPVVSAVAEEATFVRDGISYYGDDISVTVTVEDVNFDKSKVVMTETTKLDGNKDSVKVTNGKDVSWNRKEGTNTYTTTIVLAGGSLNEGAESFTVEYTNNSGYTAEMAKVTDMVIDRTAPTDLVITYKESDSVFGTLADLISKLSNGFIYFGKSVEVEIKVVDTVSPIDRFVYSAELDETAGVGSAGIEETTTKDITYDNAEKVYKTTFTVPSEYKGKIEARAYDKVDHYIDSNEEYGIVVSDKTPVVTAKAEASEYISNSISYYSNDIPVTVTVEDVNFDASKVVMTETTQFAGKKDAVTVTNGKDVVWDRASGTNIYTTKLILAGGSLTEGAETFTVEYTNNSGHSAKTAEITNMIIDRTAPQVVLTYENNKAVRDNYYNADRSATIKVTDENFVGTEEMFELTAVNAVGEAVENAPKVVWADDKNAVVMFSTEANYTFNYNEANLMDLAGNKAVVTYADGTTNQNEFTVDKTAPTDMVITYKESESVFGTLADLISKLTNGFIYFGKSVEVSVTVTDATSPVDRFVYSAELDSTAGVGSVGIDQTTTKDISYDEATNSYKMTFTIDPEYKGTIKVRAYDKADNYVDSEETYGVVISEKAPVVTAEAEKSDYVTDSVSYYSDDISVTVTVEDVNFDASKVVMTETTAFAGKADAVTVTNGKDVSWNRVSGTNIYTTTIILAGGSLTEGYETFTVEYTNNSGVSADVAQISRMIIDRTAPQVAIKFENNTPVRDNYYDNARLATIKVVDDNFVGTEDMFAITAVNSADEGVENTPTVVWADSKNASANFTTEANYTFNYNEETLMDLAGNKAVVTYAEDTTNANEFTVDRTSPTDMVITYKESDSIFGTLADLITKLTNGFIYFGKSVEVKVTVTDATSPIDRFVYSAELDETAGVGSVGIEETTTQNITYNTSDNSYEITFTVEPEYKGEIKVRAYDKSDNFVDSDEDFNGIVVSDKVPVITIEAKESEYVNNFTSYYSDDIPVTVTVEDVNFDKSKVIMTEITTFENEEDAITVTNGIELEWVRTPETNVYTASLLLEGGSIGEGHETFIVEYTNNSNISADSVQISEMIIDRTAPKVMLEYDNNECKNGNYYNNDRTLSVTVTDYNFYGLENMVKLTALDKSLAPIGNLPKINWSEDGQTAKIVFNSSADYTFDINTDTFIDFAGNKAVVEYAEGTTSANSFTVDKIKPSVKVEYDNNEVENGKYYDNGRTATILVTDENFVGLKDMVVVTALDKSLESIENVPEIQWLSETKGVIKFLDDADYTFEFDTEKLVDLAGNKAVVTYANDTQNPKEFTVDKVKPQVKIEYDNNSYKNKNYYNAERTVFITVTDDNFHGLLDMVKVTALDKLNRPIENEPIINWISDTECVVVFEEDADYTFNIVKDTFADLAGNTAVVTYADGTTNANAFTIDRTEPKILVSYDNNSVLNGRYYDANRTASIAVTDDNFVGLKDMVIVTAVDKAGKSLANVPEINWSSETKGEIKFTEDGYYTFNIDKDKFVDLAGNKSVVSYMADAKNVNEFTVDKTNPKVVIEYNNNQFINENFYNKERVATLTVTDDNFVGLKDMVKVTALNKSQKPISSVPVINWISDTKGEIKFTADAYYTFNIDNSKFVDLAGNMVEVSYVSSTTNANKFVVDKVKPNNFNVVVKTPDGKNLGNVYTDTIGKNFAFDKYSNKDVSVTINGNDNLTKLTMYYYISRKEMTESELSAISAESWREYTDKFSVSPDRKMVIYAKAVDQSGNSMLSSSDGIILDKTNPVIDGVSPQIKLNPSSNKQKKDLNGNVLYNGDVIVDYLISDPIVTETCSGLDASKLYYEVTNNGEITQSGILEGKTSVYEGHIRSLSGQIRVDASLNNSNNVKLKVSAVDNASNASSSACNLRIDITAPEVSVNYANNNVVGDGFFNANRTATITIRERNFNSNKVVVKMTKDGVAQKLNLKWNNSGQATSDDYTHTANIVYSDDADYTFDVSYTDEASNACGNVNYGNSVAPRKFTVDKTLPTVNVQYSNNASQNNNYYSDSRTATITVVEHNFDPDGVTQEITATHNGQRVTAPQISGWSSSGDTHTATVTYSADADYVFTFACTDLASNSLTENVREEFTVDKTAPEVVIEGISHKSANNGKDGDISFTLRATDINLNNSSFAKEFVKINIDGKNENVDSIGEIFNITNGVEYRVSNIEADSVYSIKCTAVDKSGNTTSVIKVLDEDNKTIEEEEVLFSVNRHGSTFMLDENTKKIVDKGYVKEITEDIVITEINPDIVNDYVVTLDNGSKKPRVLTDGDGYVRNNKENDKLWNTYIYTIKASCFDAEAAYTLSLVTQDLSGNKSYSTTSNPEYSDEPIATVKFVVDRTKPQVVVTNIESNGRYNTEQQSVTIIAKDENALSSLSIILNGEVVGEYNADQLIENRGEITLVIDSSESLQNLEIVAVDLANNSTGDDEETKIVFNDFLITTNFFILFINNFPALIMAIIGVLLITAGVIFLIAKKRDKKKETVAEQ